MSATAGPILLDQAQVVRLREDFALRESSLDEWTARNEADVVRWRDASASMVSMRPYDEQIERGPGSGERWTARQRIWLPKSTLQQGPGVLRHGLDHSGDIRTVRCPSGSSIHVFREDGVIDLLCVGLARDGRRRLQSLERFLLEGELAHTRYLVEPGALYETKYGRDRRGFCASAVTRKILEPWSGNPAKYYGDWREERYRTDETGRLVVASETCHDRTGKCTSITYPFVSTAGRKPKRVCSDISAGLVRWVTEVAKALALGAPCRALLLGYCGEDLLDTYPGLFAVLVPATVVGQVDLWEPDEVRSFAGVVERQIDDPRHVDPELLTCCQVLAGLNADGMATGEPRSPVGRWIAGLRSRRVQDQLRRPFHAAALALNRLDWSSIMPTTADFVVLARDNTGERDLESDVRDSVPPSMRAWVRARV